MSAFPAFHHESKSTTIGSKTRGIHFQNVALEMKLVQIDFSSNSADISQNG